MKRLLNKSKRGERGQALILVLILIAIGGLIIAPLLSYMGSGLKVEEEYEGLAEKFYSADAGVEDGVWQIKNENLSDLPGFSDYDPYKYYAYSSSYAWDYNLEDIYPEEVNEKEVNVQIDNVWMPKDIPVPDYTQAKLLIEGPGGGETPPLIIVGSMPSALTYQIGIIYYYDAQDDPNGTKLKVEKIGIWIPPGFHYVNGSSTLETGGMSKPYYPSSVDVSTYKSGEAVVWSFSSLPRLSVFPGGGGSGSAMIVRNFTFQYTADQEDQQPAAALSWIDTTGCEGYGINYTWDADIKVYHITSEAEGTTIEAYAAKIGWRQMGAAMNGDYVAIGNSLMTSTGSQYFRDRLYLGSSATIQNSNPNGAGYIPPGATVDAAFLYWSGWIDYHYRHWVSGGGGHHGPQGHWEWREIPGLDYDNYAPDNLTTLVEDNARVNTVTFLFGSSDPVSIDANLWQVFESTGSGYEGTWIYNCLYDATDLTSTDGISVKQQIETAMNTPNSTYTFTLQHDDSVVGLYRSEADEYSFNLYNTPYYTGYPLGTPAIDQSQPRYQYSHAGWSLLIVYSSPETKGHQLYLYDIKNPNFTFSEAWAPGGVNNLDFDGDGQGGGTISGFLIPDEIEGETYAATLTLFVGEGDSPITGEHIKMNNTSIAGGYGDPYIPDNNMWNSRSFGLSVPGIDIDTFRVTWASGILDPGQTSADIDLIAGDDGFTLVYMIISFRSKTITGGTISYLIR